MKMSEAGAIMERRAVKRYMISFEKRGGGMLASDHFPDKHAGEPLIEGLEKAWELANKFAATAPPEYVNIYVVRGEDFAPVDGYSERMLRRYP